MRLAILGSRGYPSTYGGFETLVRHLAPYLAGEGHDVTVYCRRGGRAVLRTRTTTVDGIRCVTTPGVDRRVASTLSFGWSAARHAARERPDAAIVLNPANGFFLPSLAEAGVPTIVNVDGLEWQRDKWSALGKAVFRRGARMVADHASTIVVDARAIGDVWREQLGVRSTYIPYGADLVDEPMPERVRQLGLEPGRYVLYVARLVPENNIELFLDAAERLRGQHRIVVVGTAGYGGPIEDRLRALAARSELRWLGHVGDQELLSSLWANAGCYFHGHSVGGTNPSLLQAMGAGAPVVAYDSAFNREVLDGTGVLVPADVDRVAGAIATMLASSERRAEHGARGRDRVARAYTWDAVCGSYLQAVRDVVSDRSRLPELVRAHAATTYQQAGLEPS